MGVMWVTWGRSEAGLELLSALNSSSILPLHKIFILKWFICLSCVPVVLLMTNTLRQSDGCWNSIKNVLRPPHLTQAWASDYRELIKVIIYLNSAKCRAFDSTEDCDNHKALRWKLIIVWKCELTEKGVWLNRWLATSNGWEGERYKYKCVWSFHLFAFDIHSSGGCLCWY